MYTTTVVFTQECPTCAATIEKDGGCNHVICKNTSCKAEFCWVCLGPWEPHGSSWYNCNRSALFLPVISKTINNNLGTILIQNVISLHKC